MKKNVNWKASVPLFIAMVSIGLVAHVGAQAVAYNTIDSQLNLGDRNQDVTDLQTFLKTNASIYPEGLVTGYFGTLTRTAVQRFQAQNGIVSSGTAETTGYGRVGPMTRNAINALISSGGLPSGGTGMTTTSLLVAPAIYSVSQSISRNSATFTWNTNEMANGKVFYNTSPITMNEGDERSVGFGSTNGFSVTNDGLARVSQQVTISNLQPNTRYYYVIVSTDLDGNVSVHNPNGTFITSN